MTVYFTFLSPKVIIVNKFLSSLSIFTCESIYLRSRASWYEIQGHFQKTGVLNEAIAVFINLNIVDILAGQFCCGGGGGYPLYCRMFRCQ